MQVAKIFANSILAMGGETAVNRIQSITAVANCTGPNGDYITKLESSRDGNLYFEQVRSGQRPFAAWIVGADQGWTLNEAGEKTALNPQAITMIRSHDFQMIPLTFTERYIGLLALGAVEFQDRTCEKVQFDDELGQICHAYFDAGNYLWAGMTLANSIGEPGEIVTVIINNWQEVEGVKLPQNIVAIDKNGEFSLDFVQMELNKINKLNLG